MKKLIFIFAFVFKKQKQMYSSDMISCAEVFARLYFLRKKTAEANHNMTRGERYERRCKQKE